MDDRQYAPIAFALLASFLAGPIFLTAMSGGTLIDPRYPFRLRDLMDWAGLLPLASGVGFILAVLPNLIGAVALHWLGTRHALARRRAVWMLAGALLAGSLGAGDAQADLIILCAVTGAACAAICRLGANWE